MDSLEQKANEAVNNKLNKLEASRYIREEYGITNVKHLKFFVEMMKEKYAYKAYQNVYGKGMAMNIATVRASELMKKYKVNFIDWLELSGHGTDAITEALDDLKNTDSDKYLKHITNLKQLDIKRIEHSGTFKIEFEKDID